MSKPVIGTVSKGSVASFLAGALSLAACGLSLTVTTGSAHAAAAKALSLKDLPGLMQQYGARRAAAAINASVQASAASTTTRSVTRQFSLTERDITPNTASDDREPVFSPNGDLIAFKSNRTATNGTGPLYHLWVMNRDGSSPRQVTGLYSDSTRNQSRPSWSPDGNQLVYVDENVGNTNDDQLFVVSPLLDIDTATAGIQVGVPEQRTFLPGRKRSPIFSPSGQELFFSAKYDPGAKVPVPSYDIFTIATSGSTISSRRLTGGASDPIGNTADDLNPVFSVISPGALFFSSNRAIVGGVQTTLATGRRIWIMQTNGSTKRQITDPAQRANGRATDSDDYPSPSRRVGDSSVSGGEERVAFQSDSLIDSSDTIADLNVWSIKVDSTRFISNDTNATTQPKALLVTSVNSGEVKMFDPSSGQAQGNFGGDPISNRIGGVAFGRDYTNDGIRDLLVSLPGSDTIVFCDGITGQVGGIFKTGSQLKSPGALLSDGQYLYVASSDLGGSFSGKVSRFDLDTAAPAPGAGGGVADFTDGKGASTTSGSPAVTTNFGIGGLAFGADQNADGVDDLYASVPGLNKVNVYNGLTGALIHDGYLQAPDVNKPTGLAVAFSGSSQLYVANYGSDSVQQYDVSNDFPSLVRTITSDLAGPRGLTFGPDGKLYVSNFDKLTTVGSTTTRTRGQGNTVNRYAFDGSSAPAAGQTGSLFGTDPTMEGAGDMIFTDAAFQSGGGGGGLPSDTSIVESNTSAVVESNRYSSPDGYRSSGLEGSDTITTSTNNQDKSADREPAFARTILTSIQQAEIAFASQRVVTYVPGLPKTNPFGGVERLPDTPASSSIPSHDIWITQAGDFTPPILIPQAAGNQLYPVVAPGPQSPFAAGLRRTFESGLTPGSSVSVAVVLRENESGIDTVTAHFYNADVQTFNGGSVARLYTTPNDNLKVSVARETKSPRANGISDLTLTPYDDGPITKISRQTGQLGHERQGDAVEGDGVFYCEGTTPTPSGPHDIYIDIEAQDNAGNSFVYDNIWGFSTRQFAKADRHDLFVSDYSQGQQFVEFFDPNNESFFSGNGRLENLQPIESYWLTNPEGVVYSQTDPTSDLGGTVLARSSQTTFTNVDVWRVLCRGPVPDTVLDAYKPTQTQQYDPADFANGKPNPLPQKTLPVAVSDSSVLWSSPYTSLMFAGPGTLADSDTQRRLTNFLDFGGRLFISGKEVLYGLTNGGTESNTFVTNELRAQWGGETSAGDNRILADVGKFTSYGPPPPYIVDDNNLQFGFYPRPPAPDDNNYSDGALNWSYLGVDIIKPAGALPASVKVIPAYNLNGNVVGERVETVRSTRLESRLVFFSFGFEGINRRYGANRPPVIAVDVRRRLADGLRVYFKTGGLSGTVINKTTNQPIPNFVVEVIGGGRTHIVVTDQNGSWTLLGLPDSGYTVRPALTTDGNPLNVGYFPGPAIGYGVAAGSTTSGANLTVIPTNPGSLSGRAVLKDAATPTVTSDNPPFANSPVLLRSKDSSELFVGGGRYAQLTQTDAGGRYSFSDVPTAVDLEVIFDPDINDIPIESGLRDNYVGQNGPNLDYGRRLVPDKLRPGAIQVPIGDAFVLNDGTGDTAAPDDTKPIVVNVNPSVNGYVQLKKLGVLSALPNATITLLKGTATIATTKSDADGRYTIDDVPPGSYTIKADFAGQTVTVAITVPRTNVISAPDITFFQQALTGTVVINTDNVPAVGATVTLTKTGVPTQTTTTDSKGTYRFAIVPAGTYTVTAVLTGVSGSTTVTVVNGTDKIAPIIRILVQSVSGVVRLNKVGTGAGMLLPGATVTLKKSGVLIATQLTNAQGGYTIAAPSAGDYTLQATYTVPFGTVTSLVVNVTVASGVNTPAADLLVYLQTLTATVTLNGLPVVATVDLNRVETGGALTLLQTAKTASTGKFSFTRVPNGNYVITASAAGDKLNSNTIVVTSNGATIAVPAINLRTQTVSGTVLQNGAAAAGAAVQLEQAGTVLKTFTTLADGKFTFTGIAPGSYLVRAIKSTSRSADMTITVVRGTDKTGLVLTLVNQSVTGRVISGGVAVSGANVTLYGGTGFTVVIGTRVTGTDGKYSFGTLPAGNYKMTAAKTIASGTDSASVQFTVAAGTTVVAVPDIVLIFEKLTGKVTLNGAAASGATVNLYTRTSAGVKGDLKQTTTTDATGSYSFPQVVAGPFIVQATLSGDAQEASVTPIRNGQTTTVPTLALRLQNILGRVTLNGASGVGITVTLKSGTTAIGTATTNSNGIYTFSGISAGTYTVSAVSGSLSDTQTVTVVRGTDAIAPLLVLGTGTAPPPAADFLPGRLYLFSTPYTDATAPNATTTLLKTLSVMPLTGTTVNYVLKYFDPVTQNYVSVTNPNAVIKRGVGYTIDSVRTGLTVHIIRPAEDVSRLPTGVNTFDITLQLNPSAGPDENGVNLIGFPFDPDKYAYALWSKTSFVGSDGTIYATLEDAVAAGAIAREIYTLSSDGKSYVQVTDDKLLPFKAYFVQTKQNNLKATFKATLK